MAYDTGVLEGTFEKPDGTPAVGQVHIAPNVRVVRDATGNVILAGTVVVDLDDDGAFSVVLAATDDETLDPTGFAYTVTPRLKGHSPITGVSLPADTTVDLADAISVDPDAPEYAPWTYGTGMTMTEDPPDSGLYVRVEGGSDRLVESDEDGLYVLASDPDEADHFVTFDIDTGELPPDVEARIAELATGDYQPADSDLTAIAALTTTAFGRALLTLANAAAGRTALGLGTIATEAADEYATLDFANSQYAALEDLQDLAANTQPLDADLTAIAALSTTSFGRALLALADASAGRTALGLGTAATQASSAFQSADAELSAIAGLTSAANKLPYFTGSGTAAVTDLSAFGRALIDDADATTARGSLNVYSVEQTNDALEQAISDFIADVLGPGYQPKDSDLTAIAALTTTSFGRSLLTQADAAAARTTLGVDTSTLQPLDSDLTAIAALTTTTFGRSLLTQADAAATRATLLAQEEMVNLTGLGNAAISDFDQILYSTSDEGSTFAATYLTPFARSLIDDADAAAARTTLGAQPLDADLTAIAALTTTTYGRSLLTPADAAAARTLLGLGTAATSAATDFTPKNKVLNTFAPTLTGTDTTVATASASGIIVNSAAEADLYSYTVLAADVAALDVLELHLATDLFNASGSSRTVTYKIKLGGTTLMQIATPAFANAAATRFHPVLTVKLLLASLTEVRASVQLLTSTSVGTDGWAAMTAVGNQGIGSKQVTGLPSLGSDQILSVTGTLSAANTAFDTRVVFGELTRKRA